MSKPQEVVYGKIPAVQAEVVFGKIPPATDVVASTPGDAAPTHAPEHPAQPETPTDDDDDATGEN